MKIRSMVEALEARERGAADDLARQPLARDTALAQGRRYAADVLRELLAMMDKDPTALDL